MNRLSVVISVRNGARHLARCLPSLEPQRSDIHELIVVDDGSADATSSVARAAGVTLVRLVAPRGICAGRNAGAARASGEILAFIDADTVVRPGWAAALREAFATGASLVGGASHWPEPRTLAERYRSVSSQHDEQGLNGFLPFIAGSNFAIRRDVFEQLGGFDETLPGTEDVDLSFRAQLAGHRVTFADEAALVHFPRASVRGLLRQQVRHARDWRVAELKYRHFPFVRMRRSRRTAARVFAASAAWELLSGLDGDRRRLSFPALDSAVLLARRAGMIRADLQLLTGMQRLPAPMPYANAEQRNIASPLPGRPSLLLLGDGRLLASVLRLALEASPIVSVAPPGLEREALARWSEPAPWSLRLARSAVAAGWPLPVQMTALRIERERPRTWGDAFLTLHRVHAWIHKRATFALLAVGQSAVVLAERVAGVPIVALGQFPSGGDRVVLRVSRTDLMRNRAVLLTRLTELLELA